MRKLASIQKIVKIESIENAQNIEKATVLGWTVMVKKGEFKENELICYIEVDSILPDKPEFEFLRERNFRIRTIKLRKQISQGICFPLSILPMVEVDNSIFGKQKYHNYKEGDDVTEIIGVTKYESGMERQERLQQENKSGKVKKFFMRYNWFRQIFASDRMQWPAFIPKTDEPRIQLFPHICETEKDTLFEITEKLDGQSATYFLIRNPKKCQFWKKYIFGVCSRNFLKGKKDNSTWWRISEQYNIESKLKNELESSGCEYIVIQGEIIGEGIQKNKYGIGGLRFYVFNVFTDTRSNDNILKYNFCMKYGMMDVPMILYPSELKKSIQEMVEYSKGFSVINPKVLREGVVVRNYEKGISFKIINPEFLLKYDE